MTQEEEILGLEWAHVDMKERQITLPGRKTKSGYSRPIYADDVAYSVLKEQQVRQFKDGARTFSFVFYRMRSTGGSRTARKEKRNPERIGNFKKVWAKACKAAGLEGLLFHELRRSAIREMVRNGYSERVAMEISGHKTRSVFDRYNIVDLEDQRVAAKRRIEKISVNYSYEPSHNSIVMPDLIRHPEEPLDSGSPLRFGRNDGCKYYRETVHKLQSVGYADSLYPPSI